MSYEQTTVNTPSKNKPNQTQFQTPHALAASQPHYLYAAHLHRRKIGEVDHTIPVKIKSPAPVRLSARFAQPIRRQARSFKVPAGGKQVYRMDKHEDYNMNHKEDWFAAIKTGRKPCMDVEAGHGAATMCILGNLSYVLGRRLHWDGKESKETFKDRQIIERYYSGYAMNRRRMSFILT